MEAEAQLVAKAGDGLSTTDDRSLPPLAGIDRRQGGEWRRLRADCWQRTITRRVLDLPFGIDGYTILGALYPV